MSTPCAGPGHPDPANIRAAREAAGDTQTAAAERISSTLRTWQDWERGIARMPPGLWRLYRHVAGIERIPFPRRAA